MSEGAEVPFPPVQSQKWNVTRHLRTAAGRWFRRGRYLGPLAVALYLAAWFAITEDGFALVRPVIFPSPLQVIEVATESGGILFQDIGATMLRLVVGFGIGVVLGLGFGLAMSYSEKVYFFFNPIVEGMRPVPIIAMIPFFLMWFGIGETGKLLLITTGVFTILVVSTVEAVRNSPRIFVRAGQTLGASQFQVFRRIVIPSITPNLVAPLRVAGALAFTLVVAAEFMGSENGLGFRILNAQRLFQTDVILFNVFVITLLAGLFDALLRRSVGYLTRWSERRLD